MKSCATRLAMALAMAVAATASAAQGDAAIGKKLALDRGAGNCLACHEMPRIAENDQPGNLGPALESIKARYPDRTLLRQRVWDETRFNPNTSMPPFGKHGILTEEEIDHVVENKAGRWRREEERKIALDSEMRKPAQRALLVIALFISADCH